MLRLQEEAIECVECAQRTIPSVEANKVESASVISSHRHVSGEDGGCALLRSEERVPMLLAVLVMWPKAAVSRASRASTATTSFSPEYPGCSKVSTFALSGRDGRDLY